MSEGENAETAARNLDPRTAEVLRSLDRAKGTIAKTEVPSSSASAVNLARELRALREGLSQTTPNIEAAAQSLDSTARVLERVVTIASERLAQFQRGQDGGVSELRVSVDRLVRQADLLVAWRAWWTRQVVTWLPGLWRSRWSLAPGSRSPGEPTRWRRAPTTFCSRSSRTRRHRPPRAGSADDRSRGLTASARGICGSARSRQGPFIIRAGLPGLDSPCALPLFRSCRCRVLSGDVPGRHEGTHSKLIRQRT